MAPGDPLHPREDPLLARSGSRGGRCSNNLVCTRTVVRSSRYQTFEKVIVGPIVKVINELTS